MVVALAQFWWAGFKHLFWPRKYPSPGYLLPRPKLAGAVGAAFALIAAAISAFVQWSCENGRRVPRPAAVQADAAQYNPIPINLAGIWHSNLVPAMNYTIEQRGSEFTVLGRNSAAQVAMQGRGRIFGRFLEVDYTANYPPTVSGSGCGEILDQGRRIVGTFTDPVEGTIQVVFDRQ
jgi:hypothetical protein